MICLIEQQFDSPLLYLNKSRTYEVGRKYYVQGAEYIVFEKPIRGYNLLQIKKYGRPGKACEEPSGEPMSNGL